MQPSHQAVFSKVLPSVLQRWRAFPLDRYLGLAGQKEKPYSRKQDLLGFHVSFYQTGVSLGIYLPFFDPSPCHQNSETEKLELETVEGSLLDAVLVSLLWLWRKASSSGLWPVDQSMKKETIIKTYPTNPWERNIKITYIHIYPVSRKNHQKSFLLPGPISVRSKSRQKHHLRPQWAEPHPGTPSLGSGYQSNSSIPRAPSRPPVENLGKKTAEKKTEVFPSIVFFNVSPSLVCWALIHLWRLYQFQWTRSFAGSVLARSLLSGFHHLGSPALTGTPDRFLLWWLIQIKTLTKQ